MFSVLLYVNLRIEFLGHTIILCWIFSKNAKLFSKWVYHFTVPTAVSEGSSLSIFSPKVIIVFLNCSHSSECETVSHHGFNLHFPDYWWFWMYFHVPVGHLYFLNKLSIQCFAHFKIIFLFLSCNRFSYILDMFFISYTSVICKYLLKSVAYLFIFLMVLWV